MAVRTADNGVFITLCPVLIIADGLKTVLLKIILAAENLECIENLIFNHPVIECIGIVERFACDPRRMNKDCQAVGFSDLVVNPFKRGCNERIYVRRYVDLICKRKHFIFKLLARHNVGAVVTCCTNTFVPADLFDRLVLNERIDTVFTAEIDCVRTNTESVYGRKMNLLAHNKVELGRYVSELFNCIK